MSTLEIVLIILGLVVFVASFIVPEIKGKIGSEDRQLGESQIKEMVSNEMKDAKSQIDDMVDETIQYSVEKSERSLERVSNEKIMAVSEYAETVLKDINKNHEEVMFLYDMLNDKHKTLKDTVVEADKTAKEVEQTAKKAEKTARSAVNSVEQAVEKNSSYENEVVTEGSGHNSDDNVGEGFHPFMIEKVEIKNKKSRAKKAAKGVEQKETKQIKETESNNVDIQFETGTQGSKNNNDKILKLHNTGKSNMIIAKELGLGIGEVKLVIDLFEGM